MSKVSTSRGWPLARLAMAITAAQLAQPAQAKLDAATERQYSGVYSNACSDRSKVSLKFYQDVMMVERAGKAVTASRVRVVKTDPTGASSPDFKATVTGDVQGGDGLVFVLYHNADGLFALIQGGPKSLALLGAGVQGQRLRHCDPNRNALPGAAAAPAQQAAPDLLKVPQFRTAYLRALGPLSSEPWLTRMDGPAPPLRKVDIEGAPYTVGSVCKTHDCADNNMVVVYGGGDKVYGLVQQAGRKTVIGKPSPAMTQELDRLWSHVWRR